MPQGVGEWESCRIVEFAHSQLAGLQSTLCRFCMGNVAGNAGLCSGSGAALPRRAQLSAVLCQQGESKPFLITPKSMRGTATLSLDD